eukprot:COSAG01_NODE_20473_length_951_cov_3.245305_1_plen_69_part_00
MGWMGAKVYIVEQTPVEIKSLSLSLSRSTHSHLSCPYGYAESKYYMAATSTVMVALTGININHNVCPP